MMKKYRKKQIITGLLALFMCSGMMASAQTEMENERYINNDNWRYFKDIALESGLYASTSGVNNMTDGSITSLYGSYFPVHNMGFRSGVSYIMDINHSDYVKIPLLFAIRSRTFHFSHTEYETFWETLRDLILCIMPARCEVNTGPSLGYVHNAQRKFAASLDLNLRIGFQFWRIGINGNMGINYLLTKNFVDKKTVNRQSSRPAWFANLSIGGSFRF
jgi:hypothetical protein